MNTPNTQVAEFAAWLLASLTWATRLGAKVLLSDLRSVSGLTYTEFANLALEANRKRLITLARIDCPAYMLQDAGITEELLEDSEVSDGTSTFHAVIDPNA